MLNENQEQNVSGGSLAIQASGDLTIYSGLSVSDVRELCTLFLRDNFPKLREEAAQTAMERVQRFAEQLEGTLTANIDSLVADRFREPEVQATINEAVQAAARKGDDSNPDILADLILKKLSRDCDAFKDVLFSEAVQVVSKLSREQIAFMAFVLFIQTFVFTPKEPEHVEALCKVALSFASPGFGLTKAQRQYIQYTGAAHVTGANAVTASVDVLSAVTGKYADRGWGDARTTISQKIPTLVNLIDQYNRDKASDTELTSIGIVIAISYISNYLGPMDLSMWIK